MLVATLNGHYHIIKYFINQTEVDIDIKSYCNYTFLHSATESGNLDVVKYLVGKGADVNARDEYGFTPLHYASLCNHLDIVEYLIEDLKGGKKVYIDAKNTDDSTPLHLAAESGNLDVVKYLVKSGADIGARDVDGKTPSDIADENGHLGIVKCLNKKRVASDAKNNSDSHIAAKRAKLDKVQSNKADIESSVLTVTSILRLGQMSLN